MAALCLLLISGSHLESSIILQRQSINVDLLHLWLIIILLYITQVKGSTYLYFPATANSVICSQTDW